MAFRFKVVPGSTSPIFKQIIDQVRTAVALGTLSQGDALPSVRKLAQELVVNPNTVAKAYSQLTRDGVTEARRGQGVFVAKPRHILSRAERRRRLADAGSKFARQAMMLGFKQDEVVATLADCWLEMVAESQEESK